MSSVRSLAVKFGKEISLAAGATFSFISDWNIARSGKAE
jgi:hypothetical protein